MSVRIIVKNTPIDIPTAGESPNWGPAITEALQVLTDAVNATTAVYDIPPQILDITDYPNSVQNIDNLFFSPSVVISAEVKYAVRRQTQSSIAHTGVILEEQGELALLYHENGASGSKWEIVRSYTGNANISFSVSDAGQVKIITSSINDNFGHTGVVSYRATSLTKS